MKRKPKNIDVSCGFDKWSIGVVRTNGYAVKVVANRHPVETVITLHDASPQDFQNLANMFMDIARETQPDAKA